MMHNRVGRSENMISYLHDNKQKPNHETSSMRSHGQDFKNDLNPQKAKLLSQISEQNRQELRQPQSKFIDLHQVSAPYLDRASNNPTRRNTPSGRSF